tara:strand:- start:125 stop:739 length:615 start_codon:yes stop_codon:yes gene_type:complete
MPCTKCEEGKYKWGETGECQYDSLDACESANHKYSKMKPTPLGKKSYEEYEKELKEYNLSAELKRFEFNDVKTIEKLISAVDKQTDQLKKLAAATTEKFAPLKATDDAYAVLDEQREKIDAEQMKLGNKYEKQEATWKKARDKMNDANTYQQTGDLFDAMKKVEAMAKELGIGKVPIVAQGQKALDRQTKIESVVDKAMALSPR